MKIQASDTSCSMVHLEPVEVLTVLRCARAKGIREWAMVLLAYKHGMRASEICNLRLSDLDLKNETIVVARLKGSLRTTQALTEHRGEPLLNELRALREWLRQRRSDGSEYLFTSQKGGRLHRSQVFRLFRAIAGKAGLGPEKQHPHVLKHSIASHLISANVNLALVKQRRFPADFRFRLSRTEHENLRLQFATSSLNHGGRRYLPYAFTEHGAIMAATVLNSKRAIQMSILVVRAFVRMREALAANQQIAAKLKELEHRLENHDGTIQELVAAIRELMLPPPPNRRRIGFETAPRAGRASGRSISLVLHR